MKLSQTIPGILGAALRWMVLRAALGATLIARAIRRTKLTPPGGPVDFGGIG